MGHHEEKSPKSRFRKIVQKLQTEKKSISETVGELIQKDPLEGRINSLIMQSQNLEKEFNTIFKLFNSLGESVFVDFARQSENGGDEQKERSKSTSELDDNSENNKGALVADDNRVHYKETTSKSISPLRRGRGSFKEKKIESSIGRLLKMAKEG